MYETHCTEYQRLFHQRVSFRMYLRIGEAPHEVLVVPCHFMPSAGLLEVRWLPDEAADCCMATCSDATYDVLLVSFAAVPVSSHRILLVYLFINLPTYPIYLIYLSTYLPICLSIYLLSMSLFVCPVLSCPVSLSVCPSIHLCPSVRPSVRPSIYLSIYL